MSTFDQEALKRMNRIFDAVFREREWQEKLKAEGKFVFTCADVEMGDICKGMILGEECGEVCRAVLNLGHLTTDQPELGTLAHLRKELVQVAAVAVAWIEGLDKQSEKMEGLQR